MSATDCPFCNNIDSERVTATLGTVYSVKDLHPVTDGHMLIIPFRHTPDFFTMTLDERHDALELAGRLRQQILASDPTVSGFNVGVNCGETAGQSVLHAHVHLIPRRAQDTSDPRGGIRGAVPDKMWYRNPVPASEKQ